MTKKQHTNTSYQRRQGTLKPKQKILLESSPYIISLENQTNIYQHLPKNKPLHCEIGFGKGHHLIQNAIDNPDIILLGIDLYRPGIVTILQQIELYNLHNLYVLQSDAYIFFTEYAKKDSFENIYILHPDPWPKKRHHKRRLLTPKMIQALYASISNNSYIKILSDDISYTQQIREILISNYKSSTTIIEKHKAISNYGKKALKEGRDITAFIIKK